tara:strand:- start:6112 stop:6576 length:465 start_codon:yes stop_codon:yes gene_type:complete
MSLFCKFSIKILLISILFILNGCQLQEPYKNHGIIFLENRSKKLVLNSSNKNDVINLIGQPHSKSFNNENEWIYLERILTKGEFHKLGQNILKANNVLVLNFDKYGILEKKTLLDKNDKNKLTFSKKITKNELSQKSFIEKFFSSLKSKMYGTK